MLVRGERGTVHVLGEWRHGADRTKEAALKPNVVRHNLVEGGRVGVGILWSRSSREGGRGGGGAGCGEGCRHRGDIVMEPVRGLHGGMGTGK